MMGVSKVMDHSKLVVVMVMVLVPELPQFVQKYLEFHNWMMLTVWDLAKLALVLMVDFAKLLYEIGQILELLRYFVFDFV